MVKLLKNKKSAKKQKKRAFGSKCNPNNKWTYSYGTSSGEVDCTSECVDLEKQLIFMKTTLDSLIESDFRQLSGLTSKIQNTKLGPNELAQAIFANPVMMNALKADNNMEQIHAMQFLLRFMHGGYDNPENLLGRNAEAGKYGTRDNNGTGNNNTGGNISNTGGNGVRPSIDPTTKMIINKYYKNTKLGNSTYGYENGMWHKLDVNGKVIYNGTKPLESINRKDFEKQLGKKPELEPGQSNAPVAVSSSTAPVSTPVPDQGRRPNPTYSHNGDKYEFFNRNWYKLDSNGQRTDEKPRTFNEFKIFIGVKPDAKIEFDKTN